MGAHWPALNTALELEGIGEEGARRDSIRDADGGREEAVPEGVGPGVRDTKFPRFFS